MGFSVGTSKNHIAAEAITPMTTATNHHFRFDAEVGLAT
jgi:hypothetical protein